MAQLDVTLTKSLILLDLSPVAEQDKADKYSTRAEECLATTVEFMMLLQARIRALKLWQCMPRVRVAAQQSFSNNPAQVYGPRSVELPILPIPKVNANIWDWDNLWRLFNANALTGTTRALQVQLSSRCALRSSQRKLINRLDSFQLRSQSLKDQRTLSDQVIIQPLRKKGEQVESQRTVKRILSKFPRDFREKSSRKNVLLSEMSNQFLCKVFFDFIEDLPFGEQLIQVYLHEQRETTYLGCICRKQHGLAKFYHAFIAKEATDQQNATPQERAQYQRERNVCHRFTMQQQTAAGNLLSGAKVRTTQPPVVLNLNSNTSSVHSTKGNSQQTLQRFDQRSQKKQTETVTKVNLVA
ncbi:hypothetical protein COOONC_01240 [Cooperia oncophora]